MELEQLGNWGYQIGAVGIVAVTVTYFITVRWWTDILGRVLAAVLGSTCLVLVMSILRMLRVELPGNFFVWRAAVFWLFALAVWAGLGTMIWAQFFAPKIRRQRQQLTTPRGRGEQ